MLKTDLENQHRQFSLCVFSQKNHERFLAYMAKVKKRADAFSCLFWGIIWHLWTMLLDVVQQHTQLLTCLSYCQNGLKSFLKELSYFHVTMFKDGLFHLQITFLSTILLKISDLTGDWTINLLIYSDIFSGDYSFWSISRRKMAITHKS